jgi:hypothetical protein
MKKTVLSTLILSMAILLFFRADGFGQLLLNEDFDYVAGTPLTSNTWLQTGAIVTNPILVSNGGLSYTGYQSSGIGNAATLVTNGQDVNKAFTQQTAGTVYAGFLVSVNSAQVPGDYFFHLVQAPITSNIFKGRIWVKKDAASNNIAFGISKSSTAAATIAYTGFTYSLNTTYLIVLKYTFNAGATNDDVSIFINPVPGAAEPAPTLSYIDNTQPDATNLGVVALRQGTAANAPNATVDGIRIGQTWSDVTAAAVMVPTLSEWGLILLGLALLGFGTLYILKPRA